MAVPIPQSACEWAGLLIGGLIAPFFAMGSLLRRDRFFHPRGICFFARVTPAATSADLQALANRLAGTALVRLSAGAWRKNHPCLPDVLGFSIRFGVRPPEDLLHEDTQDLLTASARSLWTLLPDSLKTRRGSFMSNRYTGMTVFEIDGQRGWLVAIQPLEADGEGEDRFQRIRNATAAGHAHFSLQVARHRQKDHWYPAATIELLEEEVIDQDEDLLFTPFNAQLGIRPQGFIHFLRYFPYLASRAGRKLAVRLGAREVYSIP